MKLHLTAAVPGHPSLRCSLRAAPDFRAAFAAPCGLLPESAAYGACRAIAKSPVLQRELVLQSYRQRFVKRRRPLHRTLTLSGSLFDLPGRSVRLHLAIDAEGVTVEQADFFCGG